MKKSIIPVHLLIFVCTVTFPVALQAEKKPQGSTWSNIKESSAFLATAYAAHMIFSSVHEAGHLLVAQLALKAKYPIMPDAGNPQAPILSTWSYYGLIATYPEFENPKVNALINAAGPLLGIVGIYSVLKLLSIYQERNKGKDLKQAIQDGIKKDLLNDEQPLPIKAAALAHLAANIGHLIPFETRAMQSDGHKVRNNIADIFKQKE